MIYSILLLSPFVLYKYKIWGDRSYYVDKRLINYVLLLLLFLLVGTIRPLFYETDYYAYTEMYNWILKTGDIPRYLEGKEIGYRITNQLFAYLDMKSIWFFGIYTMLTWSIFIGTFKAYSHLLPLSLFFTICNGFLFWSFDGIRQSVSIMIFFYAIKFIIRGDLRKYISCIAIALLFHYSAILMLPFYLLRNFAYNRFVFLLLFVISLAFIGSDIFVEYIKGFIIYVSEVSGVSTGYEHYILEEAFKVDLEKGNNSGLGMMLRLISSFYILYSGHIVLKHVPNFKIYYVCFLIATLLNNLFFGVPIIARVTIYFNIVFGMLMGASIYYSNTILLKLISISFMVIFYGMLLVTNYRLFY